MPEKRESLEGADSAVPQDPRDKAKATLPEPQSPAVEMHTRCYSAYNAALPGAARSRFAGRHLRLARRWLAKPLKGMSGAPTSRSTRSAPTERGIAYRTRVPRRRSPRSSRRTGEPSTGRRGTGWATSERGRVRDAREPDPSGGCPLESCLRSKDSRAVRGGAVRKVPAKVTRWRPTLLHGRI
jgi:hypothetical protein